MSWSLSPTNERVVSSISSSVLNDPALRNDLIALGLDPRTGEQTGTLSSPGHERDTRRESRFRLLRPAELEPLLQEYRQGEQVTR